MGISDIDTVVAVMKAQVAGIMSNGLGYEDAAVEIGISAKMARLIYMKLLDDGDLKRKTP